MRDFTEQFTDIWRKYLRSRDYLDQKGLVRRTDECWRFYLGDQWHGLESGGERLPMINFIKPIVRYKTAVVSQNSMTAVYSPAADATPEMRQACELLNKQFRQMWEKGKLDTLLWEVVKAAQIQGEAYLFYGTPSDMQPQLLANVNVLLADEQEADIQKQKYVLIYERCFVSDVRAEALRNGISADQIETIVSDDETDRQLGNTAEIRTDSDTDGKCSSILYLAKDEDGVVRIARSTKTCIYQPLSPLRSTDAAGRAIGGLTSYPIVPLIWETIPNSARGNSEVRALIANQLEYNKTLARRSVAVKLCAFPRIAYDSQSVTNPDALDSVGAKIQLQNVGQKRLGDMVQYLSPQGMSNDAKGLSDELLNLTRELAGAGDIATGSIDPTKASGAAIVAVKNQNELPLNEALAKKSQFVEDLALLWYDMWVAYNPNGLRVEVEDASGVGGPGPAAQGKTWKLIAPEVLAEMKVNVRVDVSQANPFSKLAQEQALERMLMTQQITFEEYVEALDDDSNVPKQKIRDILEKRKQQQGNPQEQQLQQFAELTQQQNQTIARLAGGEPEKGAAYEMPAMQQ